MLRFSIGCRLIGIAPVRLCGRRVYRSWRPMLLLPTLPAHAYCGEPTPALCLLPRTGHHYQTNGRGKAGACEFHTGSPPTWPSWRRSRLGRSSEYIPKRGFARFKKCSAWAANHFPIIRSTLSLLVTFNNPLSIIAIKRVLAVQLHNRIAAICCIQAKP